MKWTNSYRSFGLKTKRSTGLKTIEHKQPSNNRTRRVPFPEISTSQPEASSGPNRRARRIMRSAHIMETLSTETHKPSNSKAFYQFPE